MMTILSMPTKKSSRYDMANHYNSLFIKENSQPHVNHDQLFKELVGNFFEEFLAVFFPDQHALIDFSTITPLSQINGQ